jgi:hypothetical protein
MEIPKTTTLLQPIPVAEQLEFQQQLPIEEEQFLEIRPFFFGKNYLQTL